VSAEGVRALSAVLKCAANPTGVCSREALRRSLYVLQASSCTTIVTRRSEDFDMCDATEGITIAQTSPMRDVEQTLL
jgi:hypothetical protein